MWKCSISSVHNPEYFSVCCCSNNQLPHCWIDRTRLNDVPSMFWHSRSLDLMLWFFFSFEGMWKKRCSYTQLPFTFRIKAMEHRCGRLNKSWYADLAVARTLLLPTCVPYQKHTPNICKNSEFTFHLLLIFVKYVHYNGHGYVFHHLYGRNVQSTNKWKKKRERKHSFILILSLFQINVIWLIIL